MYPDIRQFIQLPLLLRRANANHVDTSMCNDASQPGFHVFGGVEGLKVLETLKENVLDNLLRNGPRREKTGRDSIHHCLVSPHQRLEILFRDGHRLSITNEEAVLSQKNALKV